MSYAVDPSFFSSFWTFSLLVTGSIITFILLLGKYLNRENLQIISLLIALVLAGSELFGFFHLWSIGLWTPLNGLPLHMCDLSLIMAVILMFSRSQLVYEILFYWGAPAALTALFFPNLIKGGDLFLLINYYLIHGGILLGVLWATLVLGFRPSQGSVLRVFLFTQLLIPCIGTINWLLGTNYMFMCNLDGINNPLPVVQFPYHFMLIDLCVFLSFILMYLPFFLKRRFFKLQFA